MPIPSDEITRAKAYARRTGRGHWYHWQITPEEVKWLLDLERRADMRAPHLRALKGRREKLHAAMQREFDAYGGRNKWIWHQCRNHTYQSVAEQIGLTVARVKEIEQIETRYRRRRIGIQPFERPEINKGRPIDMGGPRDVWLTFFPSPDPRLDNMEPSDEAGP